MPETSLYKFISCFRNAWYMFGALSLRSSSTILMGKCIHFTWVRWQNNAFLVMPQRDQDQISLSWLAHLTHVQEDSNALEKLFQLHLTSTNNRACNNYNGTKNLVCQKCRTTWRQLLNLPVPYVIQGLTFGLNTPEKHWSYIGIVL